ncbi:MAG: FAD-binding oxidoreductase [Gammaproteobacteria bacterium]|nr:FAD-binding oxidoreductase [Gammaproteobacteria bacterium]
MPNSKLDRRRFIALASAASAPAITGACGKTAQTGRRYAPVDTSAERVIRTVAGLRPYRPSGFVVRSERIAGKTIVHNYGHGGAGVTLSWGTASLAVDEVPAAGVTRVAVLGAGAVGLATARLLQQRGFQVAIYARELSPNTTSNVAGALWFPTSVYEPASVSPEFIDQFTRACRISQRRFQDLVGNHYGIRWLETHFLYETLQQTEFPGGADLYPGQQLYENPSVYFGAPYAQQFFAMMIDSTTYLDALLRDFVLAGGEINVTAFESLAAVIELPETVVMNCTGLGARDLFGDDEIIAVKGQLVLLLPQTAIDYAYVVDSGNELLYMFPRANEIMLGGTSEYDNWSLDVEPEQVARILQGHSRIAAAVG